MEHLGHDMVQPVSNSAELDDFADCTSRAGTVARDIVMAGSCRQAVDPVAAPHLEKGLPVVSAAAAAALRGVALVAVDGCTGAIGTVALVPGTVTACLAIAPRGNAACVPPHRNLLLRRSDRLADLEEYIPARRQCQMDRHRPKESEIEMLGVEVQTAVSFVDAFVAACILTYPR